MDWLFLLLLGLALFLTRDALLLGSRVPGAALKATVAYAAVFLAVFVLLGAAADFVSRDQALSLLRDARLWIPATLVHAALCIAFLRARNKTGPSNRAVWLILVPAPVFLYCAGGLCWLAITSGRVFDAAAAGGLLGCAWVALVIAGARWARRLGSARSPAAILDFAAAANLSAILLLPLHQQSEQSALAENALQWQTSVMALAATAGLIGASFLFHRLRRSP
ncbi:MAG: hypothetical protein WD733_09785 [Bryobacterales bacterium]